MKNWNFSNRNERKENNKYDCIPFCFIKHVVDVLDIKHIYLLLAVVLTKEYFV